MRPALPLFLLMVTVIALSACGRKPSEVPAPDGSTWPRSYPAENTSPTPDPAE